LNCVLSRFNFRFLVQTFRSDYCEYLPLRLLPNISLFGFSFFPAIRMDDSDGIENPNFYEDDLLAEDTVSDRNTYRDRTRDRPRACPRNRSHNQSQTRDRS